MSALRFFGDLRIRNKLLLAYSAIFILSISASGYIIYVFVGRTIESNIESELQNTTAALYNMVRTSAAISIKNHLRAVADRNREIAAYFYHLAQTGKLTDKEARARAGAVMLAQKIGKTGYIYCINSKGVIVIHPKKALLGVDLSSYRFIQEQKKRKEGYLEYDWKNPGETHARPKALYMTYFKPWDWIISVSSYRDEFNELIKVGDFRQSILSLRFGKTGYSYVLDTAGNLIVHPKLQGRNYYNARDASGQYFIREICKRKNGKIIYSWKNPGEKKARMKLVIFHYIPEYHWIVASSSYLNEFYAPLRTLRRIVFFTVCLTLLIVLPITMRISASITNPLRALMVRFARGAEGDISVRMVPRTNDELGQLARYFNSFMDRLEAYSVSLKTEISDRKRAEAAIRKSEAKYRELVENANSIILRMNCAGDIMFFNEYAQTFFGFTEAEILGRPLLGTLIPEKDSSGRDLAAILEELRSNPDAFPGFQCEARRRNGLQVWISWTNRAIKDAEGNTGEYLCIGNDVTATRLAEREMNRIRHYLKSIIDSMPSILVGVDPSGIITLLNREAEKAATPQVPSALGRPLADAFPFLASHLEMVCHAIRERAVTKMEKVADARNGGDVTYTDIMVYPLSSDILEGAVIRIDDVSQRVRMEDMMVQTEKMLSVGGLAAGMAHEINNPLSGMLQSTQNILRRIDPKIAHNREVARNMDVDLIGMRNYLSRRGVLKFIDDIRVSGERATKTVTNMLRFSRRSDSRLETVQIERIMESTIELATHDYDLKKKYDFRKIRIERDFEVDLPAVPCIPMEIEQVLLNLLRNAAQAFCYTSTDHEEPKILLRLRRENGFVRIDVEDNGPGMDDETRKRAFEPFFTTKDVGVGTGLGLSVSYFIITNNHHGTMTVTTAPGTGTVFSIRLPVESSDIAVQGADNIAGGRSR